MSLIGFRYLNRQRVLTLVLILALTSALFLVTALSFLGFYNGFSAYLGEEKDTVAIYSNTGRTPFTGQVPSFLADNVSLVSGVLACSPEAIAPSVVNDKSVFIRGIMPEDFRKITPLKMTQGDLLTASDVDAAIIGAGFSERLNLKVGDKFMAFGVLSPQLVELQVKGIYVSGSVMDDEALVPLYIGQWLRGSDYNHVTLIRVKMDPAQLNAVSLYSVITKDEPQTTAVPSDKPKTSLSDLIPLNQISFKVGSLGVEDTQTFMQSYLSNYGVNKDTFVILSVVVMVLAGGTAACALTMFLNQHKSEISVMHAVGASERKIKTDLLLKLLAWSFVASTLGVVFATIVLAFFGSVGYLQVLSHGVSLTLDPSIIFANFALVSLLVVVGVIRWDVKQ
jgi:ABC-type lipoprotein release transport system permease subunit